MQSDSVTKIIERYFATVTLEKFTFRGKEFFPQPLRVSSLLLRDYTCPANCGGCCFKFTLDYLPSEGRPVGAIKRLIDFNGRQVEIWSDFQEGNQTSRCRHLQPEDGRCGIYQVRPFSCDFELIRTLQPVDEGSARANVLTQKLFGRGWSYPRVDGGQGALCEMKPVSEKSVAEVVRKLKRLEEWTNHFRLQTWVSDILGVVRDGRLARSTTGILLFREKGKKTGLGL